jgi:hypothetical protein
MEGCSAAIAIATTPTRPPNSWNASSPTSPTVIVPTTAWAARGQFTPPGVTVYATPRKIGYSGGR